MLLSLLIYTLYTAWSITVLLKQISNSFIKDVLQSVNIRALNQTIYALFNQNIIFLVKDVPLNSKGCMLLILHTFKMDNNIDNSHPI